MVEIKYHNIFDRIPQFQYWKDDYCWFLTIVITNVNMTKQVEVNKTTVTTV